MRPIVYGSIALASLAARAAPARSAAIKFGLLTTSSSAVTVIAIERGYFIAEGGAAH